jgi:beta-aspartyl-peptidase (threonine type)
MDAAIMDGATLKAGAVADVQHTRHPIALARAVMDKSQNVMMIGAGADSFAIHVGLQQEPASFFFTENRWQNLIQELKKQNLPIPSRPRGVPPPSFGHAAFFESPDTHKYGTVGVVALDQHGNVAAGTSTGGLTAKRWDRVGDSPIIGAGTYASNDSCAVSATGTGEYFIRLTVARTICALVQYKHMRLQPAVNAVITQVGDIHGDGGVIAVTPDGQQAWGFNTPGMFRAKLKQGGKVQIGIYRDEP